MSREDILALAEEELNTRIMSVSSRIEYAKIDIRIGPEIVKAWKKDLAHWQELAEELQIWRLSER